MRMPDLKLVTETPSLAERLAEVRRRAEESGRGPKPADKRCSRCEGTRFVRGETGAQRCPDCQPSVEQILERAGVPAEQRSADLSRAAPQCAELAAILADLADAEMRDGDRVRSLYLCGEVGVGKTWLAGALVRRLVERHHWSVAWVTVRDWLRELQAVFQSRDREGDGETEARIVERYYRPRVVVLNELPRTRVTDWVAEQVEGLIDHRNNAELVTVVTGNLSLDEIGERYNQQLASRMGERYFDRVPVGGEDLRGRR